MKTFLLRRRNLVRDLTVAGEILVLFFCAECEAKTIYVDRGVASSGDGRSWATAVKTIQEGVDKASTEEVDTVLVAPGEYADEPGYYGSKNFYYRIKLDRKVILKSAKGKEATHIVGRRGNGAGGNDADTDLPPVTCVYIPSEGRGSVVEGFTIRDGEAPSDLGTACRSAGVGDPTLTGNSSYALANEPDKFWYVAYCTISNCCAARGSAVSGGTLIGTVISDNESYANNFVSATYVHAYNSVFMRNASTEKLGANAWVLVNCMVVNEGSQRGMYGLTDTGSPSCFYNCAIFNAWSSSSTSWNTPKCSYCLVDSKNGETYVHEESDHVTGIPITDKYTNLVMSVITGDWRPVKGGRLDGKGDRTALGLSFIPAEYANRDFNGDEIEEGASIPIGVILPSAEPATAGLFLPSVGMKLNGHSILFPNHVHYADAWPTNVEFSADDGQEDLFEGITVDAYSGEGQYRRCRGKYASVALTLPPCEDADGNELPLMTARRLQAAEGNVLWVDDDAEFDGDPDGSSEKPYSTLQAAVDAAAAVAGQPFHIINVRGGVYNVGTTNDNTGIKARVVVGATGNFVMRGVDGAASTFVEGAPDESTLEDETNPGIGSDACRCFWMDSSSNVALVDLTLRKGYGGLTSGNGSGGAVYCGSDNQQCYDCVFTDNHIVRENASAGVQLQGSCALNGWLVRCVFKDNLNYNRGLIKSTATACQFVHNARGCSDNANAERYCWQSGSVFLSTVYEPDFKINSYSFNTSARTENSVIVGGDLVASSSSTSGKWVANIGYGFKHNYDHEEGEVMKTDPWLAFVENGDFHPVEGSPIVGYAEFPKDADMLGERLRNICTDFENKSVFSADGKITVGAFATVHEKSAIYVDATNGNDANDGLTTATAKKTLKAAVGALSRKDTIVALPGTYNDGSMIHSVKVSGVSSPLTVRARVVVPDYSELVAYGSAEETIIEGAADPNPTGSEDDIAHGLGTNAVRGVVLGEGSVLRGFTVTNGHARGYDDTEGYSDNVNGGGVLGRSAGSSRVEDCVVQGNNAGCGGGGAYVTFARCRILGNVATTLGAATRYCSLVDTYVDGNLGERTCERVADVIGCTFGPGNLRLDGTMGTMTVCNPSTYLSARIWNVLSCSPVLGANQVYNGDIRNCVFPSGAQFTEYTSLENVDTSCAIADLQSFYDAGVPNSLDAPTVDAGCTNSVQGDVDLVGNQRIYNSAIDIGCCEADWRPRYARDLGGRLATVTEASAGVRDVSGAVVLADGAELAMNLASDGCVAKLEFTVSDGTLTVTRNGQELGQYTSGQSISIADTADLESFRFSYSGTGSATLACCKVQVGTLIIFR